MEQQGEQISKYMNIYVITVTSLVNILCNVVTSLYENCFSCMVKGTTCLWDQKAAEVKIGRSNAILLSHQ